MTAAYCNFIKETKVQLTISFEIYLTRKSSNKHECKIYELAYVDQLNNYYNVAYIKIPMGVYK